MEMPNIFKNINGKPARGLVSIALLLIGCGSYPGHNANEGPALNVSPLVIDLGSDITSEILKITNGGGGTLTWSVSAGKEWLSVSNTSGTATTETDAVSVAADRTGLVRGSYTGTVDITSDGGDRSIPVNMSVPNHSPVINSTPPITAEVNTLYSYDVEATDEDGDTLNFTLNVDPPADDMSIDPVSGRISWTPTSVGYHSVTVSVEDGAGGEASRGFTIYVVDLKRGLVAYYPFNGNVDDESGNGNDGVINGGAIFTTDRFGNPNGALSLDGVDDYVLLPNESHFDLTEFTIIATVRVPNLNQRNMVLSKGSEFGNYTFDILNGDLGNQNGGKATYVHRTQNGNWSNGISSEAVPTNEYFQLAITYGSGVIGAYYNGNSTGIINNVTPPVSNDSPVTIGRSQFSSFTNYFLGDIDDIRIYSRALSEFEIQGLYTDTETFISGLAFKGAVAGGTVTAYAVTKGAYRETLATAETASDGSYNLSFGDYSGPVYLEITGGSYSDEATGTTINLSTTPGSGLKAVVDHVSPGDVPDCQITPLTTMAAALAEALPGGLTALNINNANDQIGQYYGNIDIIHTRPTDPTIMNSSYAANLEAAYYGLILAGLSQQAHVLMLANPMDLVFALAKDASDGVFDGREGTSPIYLTDTFTLTATAGGVDLVSAFEAFIANSRNISGIVNCKVDIGTYIYIDIIDGQLVFRFLVCELFPPIAPSVIAAVAGDGRVTVSWEEVSEATSYNLYYSPSQSITPDHGTQISNVTSPHNVTGIVNGTPYYFIVTAVNKAGESEPSSRVSAIPVSSMRISDINFADPNLSACVNALGLTYAYEVTTLSCTDRGINDLSGIEELVNLSNLDLDNNSISDISPLVSLTNLARLKLGGTYIDSTGNHVSDLRPLESLANLTELFLSKNSISDVGPLSSLTNLDTLYLDHNSISDISPLESLINLRELWLRFNNISDISPLSSLSMLTSLNLNHNNVCDISMLASLPRLTLLGLGDNNISDISPLASLTAINTLWLDKNGLTDLSPLSSLTNIRSLYLKRNSISDISPLASLIKLANLDLYDNTINDISPLSSLTGLGYLTLGFNNISDVSPLASLINLKTLYLSSNNIKEISPLLSLTGLTRLYLANNSIGDIRPVSSLTDLTFIDLWNAEISDISPLSSLTHLTELYLSKNSISDVGSLDTLVNLTELHLNDNDISTGVAMLTALTKAAAISLRGNDNIPCTDLNALIAALGSGVVTPPDSCAPANTIITNQPQNPSNSDMAGFEFDYTDDRSTITFQCEIDHGGYADCTSPQGYSNLTEGIHTFCVKATDEAGLTDPTPACYTWEVVTDKTILNKDTCESASGHWDDCGSACRGSSASTICIQICVSYCECLETSQCPEGYECAEYVDGVGICK